MNIITINTYWLHLTVNSNADIKFIEKNWQIDT